MTRHPPSQLRAPGSLAPHPGPVPQQRWEQSHFLRNRPQTLPPWPATSAWAGPAPHRQRSPPSPACGGSSAGQEPGPGRRPCWSGLDPLFPAAPAGPALGAPRKRETRRRGGRPARPEPSLPHSRSPRPPSPPTHGQWRPALTLPESQASDGSRPQARGRVAGPGRRLGVRRASGEAVQPRRPPGLSPPDPARGQCGLRS